MRIHVNGKDCAGLNYALGMGEPQPEDFVVKVEELTIHIDPFCAFYLPLGPGGLRYFAVRRRWLYHHRHLPDTVPGKVLEG